MFLIFCLRECVLFCRTYVNRLSKQNTGNMKNIRSYFFVLPPPVSFLPGCEMVSDKILSDTGQHRVE